MSIAKSSFRGRRWAVPVVVVLAVLAGFAIATEIRGSHIDPLADGYPVPVAADGSVAVSRHTLVSVLALDASVVASPEFSVLAPRQGIFEKSASASGVVVAGAVLGWISNESGRVPVPSPVDATVLNVAVSSGAVVPAGLPLIDLKANAFGLIAVVPDVLRYRLFQLSGQATAQIDKGPGPFDCPVLGGPKNGDQGVIITCAAPADVHLFSGLAGIVAVQTGRAANVLALPVGAVAGTADVGLVSVRTAAGSYVTRKVKLGLTDGSFVEIRSGLTDGDVVRIPPPALVSAG